MGMQVSRGIHTEISKKDRLLGNAGRYPGYNPGFMQVERCSYIRGESNAGPHPSAVVDTAQIFSIQLHGIPEREKCDDDLRAAREFEV